MRMQGRKLSKTVKVWAVVLLSLALALGLFPLGGTLAAYASGDNQIAGIVWQDANGDGAINEGESPVAGATVALSNGAGYDASATTDAQGAYSIGSIPPGSYTLTASGEGVATYTSVIDIADEEAPVTMDGNIGMAPVAMPTEGQEQQEEEKTEESTTEEEPEAEENEAPKGGAISGRVWLDENNDGLRNSEEIAAAGLVVSLYRADDLSVPVASETTDADGAYSFQGLEAGTYKVGIAAQTVNDIEYLLPMRALQAGADNKFDVNWDASPVMATSENIGIGEGTEPVAGIDAGMRGMIQVVPLALTNGYVVSGGATGKYNTAADAVAACPTGVACTITLMGNDTNVGNVVEIPAGKIITFTSGSGGPYTMSKGTPGTVEKVNTNREKTYIFHVKGTLTLEKITLCGIGAPADPDAGTSDAGGGAYVDGGTFTMAGGAVIKDGFAGQGGGVYMKSGSFTMSSNARIENCTSATSIVCTTNGDGGGVYVEGGTFTMNGTATIENCEAYGHFWDGIYKTYKMHGGGVFVKNNAAFTMNGNAKIENCTATYGGGVYVEDAGALVTINDSAVITRCTATNDGGGGLCIGRDGSAIMTGGEISYCVAQGSVSANGGGVCLTARPGVFTMTGGSIHHNEAVGYGGGIYGSAATVTLNGGAVEQNTAKNGGGVFVSADVNNVGSTLTLGGASINNNISSGDGAGVSLNFSTATMTAGSITGNVAGEGKRGGGVYANGDESKSKYASFTMSGGTIANNVVGSSAKGGNGGGVYLQGKCASFAMTGGSVVNNTAPGGDGGGIYTSAGNYLNLLPTTEYMNIAISGSAVVSGNVSGKAFEPPVNYEDFAIRGTNPFDGALLTNHQINYRGPFLVIYRPGAGSGTEYHQNAGFTSGGQTVKLVDNNTTNFTPPAANPTYEVVEWNTKADGTGDSYAIGEVLNPAKNLILYAQWGLGSTDVTISKTVEGKYADLTKEFTFTVTIRGRNNTNLSDGASFTYTGASHVSGVPAPAGGTLTIIGGKATIHLRHGQSITIQGIAVTGSIEIVEEDVSGYSTSFKDSKAPNVETGRSTGVRTITDATPRSFAFTNKRAAGPSPTGVSDGGPGAGLLGTIALLGVLMATVLQRRLRKKARGAS